MGGKSKTVNSQTTTQDIDTTSVGLQDIDGVGVAAGGDVEFNQTVTDLGAIQGAFDFAESSLDFAGEFGDDAFDFANDIAKQSGENVQFALATSADAIQKVGDATRSDTSQALVQLGKFAALAVAAVFAFRSFSRG